MIRRPRRTVPATIVGVVLLALAVVVAVSCIQLIVGSPPLVPLGTVAGLGRGVSWNAPVVLAGGAVLALIGLVLLACAILPGTPKVLALASTNDHTDAGVARHSLGRDLASHARSADGITDAHVTVGARSVKVNARTLLGDRSGLSERVRDAVTERLEDINLARRPRVRVTITPERSPR